MKYAFYFINNSLYFITLYIINKNLFITLLIIAGFRHGLKVSPQNCCIQTEMYNYRKLTSKILYRKMMPYRRNRRLDQTGDVPILTENVTGFLSFYSSFQKGDRTDSRVASPERIYVFLTLVLLNPDISCFANSVDPDQLASEEAN